jgi:hypothetical protein
MFQWKARLAAVTAIAVLVASLGGRFSGFEWLHWVW